MVNFNQHAFTIIELLVAISVIILFSGFTFASYNNFISQKKLDTDASRLFDVLTLARQKTQAGDEAGSCTGSFIGYEVTVIDQSTYTLQRVCSSANSVVFTYRLQTGMQISPLSSSIEFMSPDLSLIPASGVTFTVKDSTHTPNPCIMITVTTNGVINESKQQTC